MSETFILEYLPLRVKQLGYLKYHLRYRDFLIEAESTLYIPAYNSLYFIVGEPQGIQVESDYGIYDTLFHEAEENSHQHKGALTISNPTREKKRIRFIEAVLIG